MSLDEDDAVWVVLHSGSRGAGNILATTHIKAAKRTCAESGRHLEDKDLAYFMEGDAGFAPYVADMLWAQSYARSNRRLMTAAVLAALRSATGLLFDPVEAIDCHHNYAQRETHSGRAAVGDPQGGDPSAGPATAGSYPEAWATTPTSSQGRARRNHCWRSGGGAASEGLRRSPAGCVAVGVAAVDGAVRSWRPGRAVAAVGAACLMFPVAAGALGSGGRRLRQRWIGAQHQAHGERFAVFAQRAACWRARTNSSGYSAADTATKCVLVASRRYSSGPKTDMSGEGEDSAGAVLEMHHTAFLARC